ncbi:MAG: inositol monophosphatase family protein [Pseudomonadota bacterium]
MSDHASTALEAAQAAAEIARGYYRGNLEISTKEDRTPVTQADVECERAIKAIILERFPDHGFYGEETGSEKLEAEHVWLVDPIDGTKGFVREYPFFSTQIALMRRGRIVLGVSSAPMFEEIAWAEEGAGAWLNDAPIRTSDIHEVDRCALSTGNIGTLAGSDRWQAFGALVGSVDRIRGYGDFYHYHLLASGRIDAVVESDVNILDIAALSVIVTEAGGVFTDLAGQPIGLETTSVLAANPHLYPKLLPIFVPGT